MKDRKTCSACGEPKPIDQFSWRTKSKGVRYGRCNTCRSAEQREARRRTGRYTPASQDNTAHLRHETREAWHLLSAYEPLKRDWRAA